MRGVSGMEIGMEGESGFCKGGLTRQEDYHSRRCPPKKWSDDTKRIQKNWIQDIQVINRHQRRHMSSRERDLMKLITTKELYYHQILPTWKRTAKKMYV